MHSDRANLYSPRPPLFPTWAPILAMVTFADNLSFSDPVAPSFRSSKSSSLSQSQADSDGVPNQRKEHLLAVSSFLFALIWGFGAHLPSRYLQGRGWGR